MKHGPTPKPIGRWRGLGNALCAACCFLALAGSAQAQKPPSAQNITVTVLDRMDRPVAKAAIQVTPLAGKPLKPGPFQTDSLGQASFKWLPGKVDLTKGSHSQDEFYELVTNLTLKVSAPGFSPGFARLAYKTQGRKMHSPQLAGLNRKPTILPLKEVVVLTKIQQLLGGRLAGPKIDPKLKAKCLAFISANREALGFMGLEFAVPALVLKGDHLRIRMKWRGPTWGGLHLMPFKTRVILAAGLPLAMAVGEKLLPLNGVKKTDIWIANRQKPGGDELAAPKTVSVVLGGSSKIFRDLASGRLGPEKFIRNNPPLLRPGNG